MSLEEEIAIVQFGQGVRSNVDLFERLGQLDEDEKRSRLLDLSFLVRRSHFVDSDMEQAITDSSLPDDYTPCLVPSKFLKSVAIHLGESEGAPENDYKFLLYLFKAAYQRRFTAEKGNPADWWYWDLSNDEIVQTIRTRHHELVDELSADSSFRNEFVSLAKLWHSRKLWMRAENHEPVPEREEYVNFMTYDELVTTSITMWPNDKNNRGIWLLSDSIRRALVIRYKLTSDQANRLLFDVLEKHLQETYHIGLF